MNVCVLYTHARASHEKKKKTKNKTDWNSTTIIIGTLCSFFKRLQSANTAVVVPNEGPWYARSIVGRATRHHRDLGRVHARFRRRDVRTRTRVAHTTTTTRRRRPRGPGIRINSRNNNNYSPRYPMQIRSVRKRTWECRTAMRVPRRQVRVVARP